MIALFGPLAPLALLVATTHQPDGDMARLRGSWKAMAPSGATFVLTIAEKECRLETRGPDDKPVAIKALWKVDETTQPKTLDLTNLTREDGQALPDLMAIYVLEGDSLRICGATPGQPRPTRFAEGEEGPTLTVFQRVKPVKDEAAPTGDLARLQGTWRAATTDRGGPLTLTVQGSSIRVKATGPDGKPITVSARLVLDEKARPKAWTSVDRTQADGGVMPDLLGTYELDGDTLRVCNNGPGKPRPTEFKEGADGLPIITTFTRVQDPPLP